MDTRAKSGLVGGALLGAREGGVMQRPAPRLSCAGTSGKVAATDGAVTMLSGDRSIGEPIFYIVDKLVDELLITCH